MAKKMWQGRFAKELDSGVNDFNSSVSFDCVMYEEDINGSIAHATMLGKTGIVSKSDAEKIVKGLKDILAGIKSGKIEIDASAEDIHMFVEEKLTEMIGDAGKKLHTARSRNDQVAVDFKLYLKKKTQEISEKIHALVKVFAKLAEENLETVMPGFTHLQGAQPITFSHHIMAYAFMLMRDDGRLSDCLKRMNESPLGSGALAGTTHKIDRQLTAELLGFEKPTANSLDGVSDRDYAIELLSAISMIMMHLSRLSEEVILWCSGGYKFVELDDAYATGSSIMPQKKNPDIAELVRGKTGRTYGNLVTLLTVMKGLPLAYNKDMQEDKEAVFDSIETVLECLDMFAPMMATLTVKKAAMQDAASYGFLNATDCADYLAKKGIPFRTAYEITGQLVAYCLGKGASLEALKLDEFKKFSDAFEGDIYDAIDIKNAVNGRTSEGGPAKESVEKQIKIIKEFLAK